jgi:hypothetical protein
MRQVKALLVASTKTGWLPALAFAALGSLLQGCALYSQFVGRGGSLPLGDSGAEWSPAVSTPTGGFIGVQIIQRLRGCGRAVEGRRLRYARMDPDVA